MGWPTAIAISVYGFLVLMGLSLFRTWKKETPAIPKEENPCSAFHKLQCTGVKPADINGQPFTLVMQRCERCGVNSVYGLPGTWKLEDLERAPAELTALQRVVR